MKKISTEKLVTGCFVVGVATLLTVIGQSIYGIVSYTRSRKALKKSGNGVGKILSIFKKRR